MEHLTTKQKMANMNKKEKTKYIWYYYKIHIIVALLIIFSVSSFIYSKVTEKKVYCNITYIGNYMTDNSIQSIKEPLNNALLKDNKKMTFEVNCDYLNDNHANTKEDPRTKIIAEIAAKDIDIAIVNKSFFEETIKQDIFLDLNTLPGFSSLNLADYQLVKGTASDNKECVYGISVDKMNILNSVHFNSQDENILVVIANAQHRQAIMKTLKLFMK